jgi:hypothetical protein
VGVSVGVGLKIDPLTESVEVIIVYKHCYFVLPKIMKEEPLLRIV